MMCADEVHELYYIIVKIRSDRLNGCCSIFPHSISECDQTFVSRNGGPQNGTFTAPVMNNLSNHSRQCLYIFLAGPGQRVEITFTTFNLRGTPPEYVFDSLIYLRLAWTPLALCMRAPGEKRNKSKHRCHMCDVFDVFFAVADDKRIIFLFELMPSGKLVFLLSVFAKHIDTESKRKIRTLFALIRIY